MALEIKAMDDLREEILEVYDVREDGFDFRLVGRSGVRYRLKGKGLSVEKVVDVDEESSSLRESKAGDSLLVGGSPSG